MSKAVLISIQPKWCELIVNGEKTIEVRKSRPKLKTPFKCYIYCTYGQGLIERYDADYPNMLLDQKVSKEKIWGNCCNGKVIGEFMCSKITETVSWRVKGQTGFLAKRTEDEASLPHRSCLTIEEIEKYAGSENRRFYGWHISDMVIYDKPKELSEFERPCKCVGEYEGESYCDCLNCDDAGDSDYGVIACDKRLKRPPQSWCYVEELPGGADHA